MRQVFQDTFFCYYVSLYSMETRSVHSIFRLTLISFLLHCLLLAFLLQRSFAVDLVNKDNQPRLQKKLKEKIEALFDPNMDYKKFSGRMTDRDKVGDILKVFTENKNIKFFRPGDPLEFRLPNQSSSFCRGFIKVVEKDYLTLYVKNLFSCFKKGEYIRRGSQMAFFAPILEERVKDAGLYRVVLLRKKQEYWDQLKKMNQFIWNYDQKKIKVSAQYDKQIVVLENKKRKELDILLGKKRDQVLLQKEIVKKIEMLDNDLDFYIIDQYEPELDRWHLDHDLGLPVRKRPQKKRHL